MENNNYDLTRFDKVLSDIKDIQDKGNFLPDMTTKQGYEASKRFVLDVTTPARKALESAHKETKAPFLETCRFLDGKKKELMPILEAIEAPHKEAYKDVDEKKKQAKAEQEAKVQRGFDYINELLQASIGSDSKQISEILNACTEIDVNPDLYKDRTDSLIKLQSEAVSKLTDSLTKQIQYEDMEKKRIEMEQRERAIAEKEAEQQRIKDEEDRKAREAKIASEAREQARIEAENKAKEQAAIAQQAMIFAKEKAKQDAIDAENRRLADIEKAKQDEIARHKAQQEAEKQEAEKREANKKHQTSIHNGILKVLLDNGLSEEDAKTVIKLAAKRQLPNLQINY